MKSFHVGSLRTSDRPLRTSDRPLRTSDGPLRASDGPLRASDGLSAPHARVLRGRIPRARSVLLLAVALSASACGGTTPERRVQLRTEVALHGSPSFDNALGWHVDVHRAWLSIGSLRLLEGAPLGSSTSPRRTPTRPSWTDYFVKTAHAHPGHYAGGAVLAEMSSPSSVDLLSTTELAEAEAVTGEPLSGQLVFGSPPRGAHAGVLGDALVRIEGIAERTTEDGVERRSFVATATAAELGDAGAAPEIAGCPYGGGRLAEGGTLRLEVDLALWLDQVDFEALPEAGPEGSPAPLTPGERAHNGFLRGLAKAGAYRFDVTGTP